MVTHPVPDGSFTPRRDDAEIGVDPVPDGSVTPRRDDAYVGVWTSTPDLTIRALAYHEGIHGRHDLKMA